LFYKDRPRAVNAAKKKFIVARVADGLLLGSFWILYNQSNTGDLNEIFNQSQQLAQDSTGWSLSSLNIAALLLVGAAILKAAQFPTHGWLVEVMETPTPVSALLHAGILNAGPFLAIRMAFVIDGSRVATTALILIGGLTAAFASIVLLTQPSVKVMLGYSSVAHMGFMLMVCGLGLYPAALLHLVAHSFYKAHAFLSTGSVVDEYRAHGVVLPKRLGSKMRIFASSIIAIACYIPLAWVWHSVMETNASTIAIGAIFVLGMTQLVAPALDSNGSIQGSIRASFLALCVTTAFFTLEAGTYKLLSSIIPEFTNRDVIQLASFGIILAVFITVVWMQILGAVTQQTPQRRKLAILFKNGFYANAYFDLFVGALKTRKQVATVEVAK
jgi:NAD(P)H-quinone oxidoreductase subunit 5